GGRRPRAAAAAVEDGRPSLPEPARISARRHHVHPGGSGANVISPEVRDDRTITFRLRAPDANTVALTGGPILLAVGKGNTPLPFVKGAEGVWTLTVGPVKPNMYVYRLMIDGVAVPAPHQPPPRGP